MHSKKFSLIGIVVAVFAIMVVATLSFAVVEANGQPEHLQIDVCHATGSDNNPYSSLNVNVNSVEDAQNVGGHGNHEDDIWGPYTYGGVDYPGQGDLSILENGCEVPPPPPPVVPGCTDPEALNFNPQATVDDGSCQYPPPPPPPADDICPNIEGDQEFVPEGMVIDEQGNCVTPPPPPVDDVCPNIEGDQVEVPAGMHVDEQGNCVEDETPTPPPPQRKPPTVVVPPQGYVGPGADIMTFWFDKGYTGPMGVAILDRNGVWHVVVDDGDNPIVFTVGGAPAVEFRDRWNDGQQIYEKDVPMIRLVLGPNNKDVNPEHYRAFDWQTYVDTGELVFVNVWTEYRDEHCQPEDGYRPGESWGSNCGVSYNWVDGTRMEYGKQVKP